MKPWAPLFVVMLFWHTYGLIMFVRGDGSWLLVVAIVDTVLIWGCSIYLIASGRGRLLWPWKADGDQ